jgi:hypothetical protein
MITTAFAADPSINSPAKSSSARAERAFVRPDAAEKAISWSCFPRTHVFIGARKVNSDARGWPEYVRVLPSGWFMSPTFKKDKVFASEHNNHDWAIGVLSRIEFSWSKAEVRLYYTHKTVGRTVDNSGGLWCYHCLPLEVVQAGRRHGWDKIRCSTTDRLKSLAGLLFVSMYLRSYLHELVIDVCASRRPHSLKCKCELELFHACSYLPIESLPKANKSQRM